MEALGRLYRYDALSAWNTLRATFASWHDKAIAVFMSLTALAVVRAAIMNLAWTDAAWAALAAGIMVGVSSGRHAATRLAFQAFDGLLAEDATQPKLRCHFLIAWHCVGLTLTGLLVLSAKPSLAVVSMAGYVAGTLIAWATGGIRMPKLIARGTRPGWTIKAWSRRSAAGVSAATVLLLSSLAARMLDPDALMAVATIATVLLGLVLTAVDDRIVRYMAIAGQRPQRIVAHHSKGIAVFLSVAAPGSWAIGGLMAAGIVVAACVVMLLIMTLRILAYQLYEKRIADLIVSVVAGLLVWLTFYVTLALPAFAIAILWSLQARGRKNTWLLT